MIPRISRLDVLDRALRVVRSAAVLVLVGAAVTDTEAQGVRANPAAREAMAHLAWLTGAWQGEGTMTFAPGQTQPFHSREDVSLQLDGLLLTIEGRHFIRPPAGDDVVVHHAFAVISHVPETDTYRVSAHRLDGAVVDARGRMQDDAFVWGFQDPRAGHLRFTIRRSPEGRWEEVGERSADGREWVPYLRMTLSRR